MAPEAASAGQSTPSTTAPAATAKTAVLAMFAILMVFMDCPFLVPLCCGLVEKRLRCRPFRYLYKFLERSRRVGALQREMGDPVSGIPHLVGGLTRSAGWRVAGSRPWSRR